MKSLYTKLWFQSVPPRDPDVSALEECSEHESDLDLEKEVKAIGGYITDREEMIEQMFRSISATKLRAMLPEILKVRPN